MGVFSNTLASTMNPMRQSPVNPTPTDLSYPQSSYGAAPAEGPVLAVLKVTPIKNGYLVSTARYEGQLLEHYYAADLKAVGEYVTAYCVERELVK